MSNHADLSFTDEEVITIYMFGIIDKKVALKEIYVPAKNYWVTGFQTYRHMLPLFRSPFQKLKAIPLVIILC